MSPYLIRSGPALPSGWNIQDAANLAWKLAAAARGAKHVIPSRAEITDAAMSRRAECVMLNKGPHIIEALRTLDRILQRLNPRKSKKCSM
jgi:pyruvate kinase